MVTKQLREMAARLRAKGKTVLDLAGNGVNPGVFQVPMELKKEIMKAYVEDYTGYPDPQGNPDLRDALCRFEKKFRGADYSPAETIVAAGGRPLIFAAYQYFCRNHRSICPIPAAPADYKDRPGGKVLGLTGQAENGFLLNPQLLGTIGEDTSLVVLSPLQPVTGRAYSAQDLKQICENIVRENDYRPKRLPPVHLLLDARESLLFFGKSLPDPVKLCPGIRPYLLTINSVTKSFAGPGLRLGWAQGPDQVIAGLRPLVGQMGAMAPAAAQKGLARYLAQTGPVRLYLETFKAELAARLRGVYTAIKNLQRQGYPVDALEPEGGSHLSLKIDLAGRTFRGGLFRSSEEIAFYFLQHAGLVLQPFSDLGAPAQLPWFALSVGSVRRQDLSLFPEKLRGGLKDYVAGQKKKTSSRLI